MPFGSSINTTEADAQSHAADCVCLLSVCPGGLYTITYFTPSNSIQLFSSRTSGYKLIGVFMSSPSSTVHSVIKGFQTIGLVIHCPALHTSESLRLQRKKLVQYGISFQPSDILNNTLRRSYYPHVDNNPR